jgi:DNA-binding SARP family transcriptional activator/WD40 repeat protein
LAALVVEAGRVCPADRLAEALYGAAPPATWRKVVHGSISRLRQQLGSHAIVTTGTGYRLELGDDEIDARLFERLLADAERLSGVGEHERAALRLASAMDLVVGEPWADLDGWEPAVGTAARYRELARQAEEQLVREELASGQYGAALAAASELVVREPLREQRWAALALAQYRAGRQGEALRTISRARRVLAEELGLEPGPELIGLEGAILAQDPTLAGPPAAGWHGGACPYRGLAAYRVDDGEWFFGRDREIAECLGIVDATGLVAIVGASGSGKSSLALAGVAPALRRDGRDVAVVIPGANPDQVLAGLARGSVLVVDQLEELFVTGGEDQARARFAAAVVRWSAVAPVVITVRADHLAQVAELSDLAARVQSGVFLLGAMGEAELRSAIEGPAAKAGLRLEPGLVDLMISDVAGQPGALPLLSHALAETYERRDGPVLSAAGYRAVGGVQGAVARAADSVVESLPPAGRRAARDLFLRLVSVTETSDPVRQRVPRAALAGDPTSVAVLDALVGSRLVIADETTVEIAHEAVCRAWPRLRAWLDEDRDGHRLHRHLALASQEWEQSERDPSELYRGPRLEAVLDWAGRDAPTLNDTERAFLAASRAGRDAEQYEDRRRIRRLRAGLVGVAGLLVVALIAGLLAVHSDQAARHQRDRARAAQLDSQLDALESQSVSLRSTNRGAAALLAVEAYRRRPDAAARSALLATFTGSPGFVGYQYLPAQHQVTGALVPGSTKAVVALDGRDLRLLDLATGRLEARFAPPAATLNNSVLRVSADGRYVAQLADMGSAPAATALSVYQVQTRRRVFGPLRIPFPAGDVALNTDGTLVAVAGGPRGDLAVYRRADGQLVGTLPGLGRPHGVNLTRTTAAVTFGPGGNLYLGSALGPIRDVDPTTMRLIDAYTAPPLSSHNQLLITPTGVLIAAGDEAAVAIDTTTGVTRWTIKRQRGSNACSAIAVSVGTGRLYCLSVLSTGSQGNLGRVGRLEERDLATGLPTGVILDPQQGTVGDIAVTADGRQLVTFSHNAPVLTRWRLDGTGPITTRIGTGWLGVQYDPTGTMLLLRRDEYGTLFQDEVGLRPTQLSVWDPASERLIHPLDGVHQAAWAGPPGRLAVTFADGTGGFYDLTTGSRVKGITVRTPASVGTTQISADRTRLYLSYVDGRIQTLDSRTGQQIGPTIQLDSAAVSVGATDDGSRIITTTLHNGQWSMTVHDAATGRPLGRIPGINTAQIGPGNTLVAANIVGQIIQYDLHTLKPLGSFSDVRGFVSKLTFSQDGKTLMALSQDRSVSLYDTATRTRLGDPIPSKVPRQGASLRPDGAAVAVGDGNGIAVWDLNPQHLADAACRLAGRNLTPTEWNTYLAALGPYRATCPQNA